MILLSMAVKAFIALGALYVFGMIVEHFIEEVLL
jgi:hypothetical protein